MWKTYSFYDENGTEISQQRFISDRSAIREALRQGDVVEIVRDDTLYRSLIFSKSTQE